ncbi:MAG: DegV family protein [Chloroflexota bacterium]
MSKIAFVTDSTAYIPSDLCRQHNITVTPQILIWGEQTYQDGVDILPAEYYTRLKDSKVMPTTSQVPIPVMQSAFQGLVDQGYEVIGIFISSKLSGTMQSAIQAREALGSAAEKVTVLDSQTTAMALGFQVLAAARAAQDGASVQDCLALAEKTRAHTGVYFAVDTLEFLHRGGRIGGAQRLIGTALNMKPVLAVMGGRVEPVERIRTKGKALERVIELVSEQVKGKSNIRLATLHANAAAEAQAVLDKASQQVGAVESLLTDVSPVVGTHTGPGTVGLAWLAGL